MEAIFSSVAAYIALLIEGAAVLLISIGAVEAVVRSVGSVMQGSAGFDQRKMIWLRFAMWLLLGLEFELGADIIRTAIAPTWNEIGQLGAIALIRTFLNWFLQRDIDRSPRTVEAQNL